jgi:CheY-like chemotaxis protein
MLARLLAAEGHFVTRAGSVSSALEAVEAEVFDLLVSDLGLPDGSGHDLLRELLARGKAIRAIALSGYGAAADLQKSLESGFAEHITKPVNFDTLHQALIRVASAR